MSISSTSKTLARGLGKTRTGSPSIGIHELIERSSRQGFSDRIKKAVSEDEALDAAKMLSVKGRARRYVEGGMIGGVSYPLTAAAGEAAAALASRGPGRLAAAGKAMKATMHRPDLAKSVTRGALGGGVIQAVREGVELGKAKKTVRSFIDEHGKAAGVEPAPQSRMVPRRKPDSPWRYDPRPAGEF